jgi:NAD(P)H-hydrate epimerase
LEEEREALKAGIRWADVVAIGPGLSTSLTALEIFRTVLESCEIPMVIDADALNLLAQNESLLKQFEFGRRKNEADVIFTPHLGELSRLMKTSVDSIKADFISCCRSFVKTYDVTLVCKDARTLVSKRKKLTYLNSSGNEGMATAGSGDVLTGITAGLMAQGLNGFEAAIMGVYAHGLAGDYARDKTSSYYVMAQDIIQSLKELRQ